MDHAPVESGMINKPNEASEITATTYLYRIQYRRKVPSGTADAVDLIKNLMARLMQYDQTLQMLPYDSKCKANPITTTKDIPSEVEDFKIYVPTSTINNNSKVLKMQFCISSNMPLWQLKQINPIRNYLDKFQVYLDQTFLTTTDNARVGGIVMSHCQYTRRDEAANDLSSRINENEDNILPIQLTPHVLWNSKGGNKISTKLLAVECAREHSREVKKRIFKKIINVPTNMTYSNTRYFNFLPFTATGAITDKVIRSGIYLQNKFLSHCTSVTLINIKNPHWMIPTTSITLREVVLTATNAHGNTIFNTVERGAGDNKLHLTTTKEKLDDAILWTDSFTMTMTNHNASRVFWTQETGSHEPPSRVDRPDISDAHKAYANFLGQRFVTMGGGEANEGPSEPPKNKSWSRVVFGSGGKNVTDPTDASTLTETTKIHEEKKGVSNDLLTEMRKLNQDTVARATRMEAVIGKHDLILKEIFSHNNAKADVFKLHEERINQIGEATSQIVGEVDKVKTALKEFIKVMADANRQNSKDEETSKAKEKMLSIVGYLDDTYAMKTDSEKTPNSVVTPPTQEPLPGTEDALSGKGMV